MVEPGSILVVCTANICRSPMAAALLRHALAAQPEPLRSIPVVSAGVAARGGEPATEHSVTTLRKVGLDLSRHRSQPVSPELLDRALLVLVMTESHREVLRARGGPVERIHLFREFLPAAAGREIPDPYGGPLPFYEAARDEMVAALPSLLAHLRTLVRPAS
jgi:protein-tyrosine-phosphatase